MLIEVSDAQVDRIAELVVTFVINMIVFSIGMIFTELRFLHVLLFSGINMLWMTFLWFPLLRKIDGRNGQKA